MANKTFKDSDRAIRKLKRVAGAALTEKEGAALEKRLAASKRIRKRSKGPTFE